MASTKLYLRSTFLSSFCSASPASTSMMMAGQLGKRLPSCAAPALAVESLLGDVGTHLLLYGDLGKSVSPGVDGGNPSQAAHRLRLRYTQAPKRIAPSWTLRYLFIK